MTGGSPGNSLVPSGFFVFRTPLLPADELRRWAEDLAAPRVEGEDAETLAAAVTADRERLRRGLEAWLERPEIREALWVASPSLAENLDAWRREPDSKAGLRAERALVRYLVRMTSRPTPFGLFSGCSVGVLDGTGEARGAPRLRLAPRAESRRFTRFDMDYLFALAENLARTPALQERLRWRPNSSLYRAAGRWRYAEARLDGKVRTYHLVAVESTEYLDAILERAREGAHLAELAEVVVALDPDGEITREEADEFLRELVGSQILVSSLALGVTGEEAVEHLIGELASHPGGSATAEVLRRGREALSELDRGGLGRDPERYRDVARELETRLPADLDVARLFQVDLIKPVAEASLGTEVLEELLRGVGLLHGLAAPAGAGDPLEPFRSDFVERWGDRAEVPLAEVLDEEIGIGFGGGGAGAEASPLLAGLPLPGPAADSRVPWGERHRRLLNRLQEAAARGETVLELEAEDLARPTREDAAPLPDALHVMAAVAAVSEEALAAGEFSVFLRSVGGPSGARLLGRFCYADDELCRGVRKHLEQEEAARPDAVFAEIVHLPDGRPGNILMRPLLRSWEIPFLARPGVAEESCLPIEDLRVSVVGSRVVLTSQRLGKEVLPRLTTAHNFLNRTLPAYRFLCSLQTQGVAGSLGWSWGAFETAPFLPRVTHGRLVLSRASWRLEGGEIEALGRLAGAELLAEARRLRRVRRLPRCLLLADADNELPVDWENILSLESFVDVIRRRSSAQLVEPFPAPEDLWVTGPEGRFHHELIVPLVRTAPATPAAPAAPASRPAALPGLEVSRATPVESDFPPGSEWLYAKLYSGTATADGILREVVAPLVRSARASGAADHWFFLRYGDPDWHLRLRFHGDPERLHGEVLPRLQAAARELLGEGRLSKLQLDTYQREVTRYGGPRGVEAAERLFWADSEAVLGVLELLEGDAGADARWRLALRGVDVLLDVLGLDLEAKVRVSGRLRDSYSREFRVDHPLKTRIGDRYRRERADLEGLMDRRGDASSPLAPGLEALEQGARLAAPAASELRRLEAEGGLTQPVEQLAPSFAHMHVNRMIRSEARAHELVLYEFLHRLYRGQAARRRSG